MKTLCIMFSPVLRDLEILDITLLHDEKLEIGLDFSQ